MNRTFLYNYIKCNNCMYRNEQSFIVNDCSFLLVTSLIIRNKIGFLYIYMELS